MGSLGGTAPNGLRFRQASTLFLRVPIADWPRVKIGEKTEFRTMPHEASRIIHCYTPTPVVAYAPGSRVRRIDTKLMVLEERRYEPLFEVSQNPEALAREGFETYDLFRRYWRARTKGSYRPMQRVWVWRVRAWRESDQPEMAAGLLKHLYGEFL